MNKLHRRIQRNERRYIKRLCKTISKANAHKYPSMHRMARSIPKKSGRSHYLSAYPGRRDRLDDTIRTSWYTRFAMTPKRAALELPRASSGRIRRMCRYLWRDEAPSPTEGNFFSVKFPLILFACGLDPETHLDLLERHYVNWQAGELAKLPKA